jgi:hypothetical protein
LQGILEGGVNPFPSGADLVFHPKRHSARRLVPKGRLIQPMFLLLKNRSGHNISGHAVTLRNPLCHSPNAHARLVDSTSNIQRRELD